jgi:hypothetical protein
MNVTEIVNAMVKAKENPMDCNMFEKKCDLLTCHTKGKCLWTKEEAEAQGRKLKSKTT